MAAGQLFSLHRVDVLIGNEHNQTVEIIGVNPQTDEFTMQYYDSKGNSGNMTGEVENGVWTLYNENLRYKGSFNANETVFGGIWQQLQPNGSWTDFIEIVLTKNL